MAGKKSEEPSRYRRVKADCSIPTLQQTIENTFGLPQGSVRIIYPSQRKAPSNADVGLLRKRWLEHG